MNAFQQATKGNNTRPPANGAANAKNGHGNGKNGSMPPNAAPDGFQESTGTYQEALELVKKMGSRAGFNPIPPDQHEWALGAGLPPMLRMWGAMCHHTIHWGHRKPYAVTKEGVPLTLENMEEVLGMSEGETRRAWLQGVERGLWRVGTQQEGPRRLYLCGSVAPYKGEQKTNETVCTDCLASYPPYQREVIKALTKERLQEFLGRAAKLSLRDKAVIAELMAAGREVIGKDHDTLFRDYAIPKIRETHEKRAAAPEEIQARQRRIAALLPVVEQFVQTFEQSVQTAESSLYEPEETSVQPGNAAFSPPHPYCVLEPIEKPLEGGRDSSSTPPSSSQTLPENGRGPVKQQYAQNEAAQQGVASRETRSAIVKKAHSAKNAAEAKPVQIPDLKTPESDERAGAVKALFLQLENMQMAYPHTDFSYEHVNPENAGDRATVGKIVEVIKLDVVGFCVYVAAKFKGLDRNALGKAPARSPEQVSGPRSLGLVLLWAQDYARGRRAAPPRDYAREGEESEYQRELKTRRGAERVQAVAAGVESESYVERKYREEIERRKKETPNG